MEELTTDTPRLTVRGTFTLFASTAALMLRDYRVLLPTCLATAAVAFLVQHAVDASFAPSYHFMDAACYVAEVFCKVDDPDLDVHPFLTWLAGPMHILAEATSTFLAHAASVLIDLACCTLLLAPLLRLIATRVDALTSYSSQRSTRQTPQELARAWRDHLYPFGAIAIMGLASLAHGSIPGVAGLSSVAIPFAMLGALIFSVSPIGFARGYGPLGTAEVALYHKPMPMLIFTAIAGPLLLVSPSTFLLLPYFVAVCTRIFVVQVTDPDTQTPAGAILSDVGKGLSDTFGGKRA